MRPCLGACSQAPGSTEAIFGKKPTSFLVCGHPNLMSTAEEISVPELTKLRQRWWLKWQAVFSLRSLVFSCITQMMVADFSPGKKMFALNYLTFDMHCKHFTFQSGVDSGLVLLVGVWQTLRRLVNDCFLLLGLQCSACGAVNMHLLEANHQFLSLCFKCLCFCITQTKDLHLSAELLSQIITTSLDASHWAFLSDRSSKSVREKERLYCAVDIATFHCFAFIQGFCVACIIFFLFKCLIQWFSVLKKKIHKMW